MPGLQNSHFVQVCQILGKRAEQQDRYLITTFNDGLLLVIADGHNGTKVASLITSKIAGTLTKERFEILRETGIKNTKALGPVQKRKAIRRLAKIGSITKKETSGSTLTLAFIQHLERLSDHKDIMLRKWAIRCLQLAQGLVR